MQKNVLLAAVDGALCSVMLISGTNEVFQLLLAKHPTKNIYEVKRELVRAYTVCYQYIW